MGTYLSDLDAAYRKIEERFSCAHATRELRKRRIAGGSEPYVRQCVVCGHTSSPVKKDEALQEANGKVVPPYDNEVQDKRREAKSEAYKKAKDSLLGQRSAEYDAYMVSDAWKNLRRAVLQRARELCEGCGKSKAVEVHHTSYEHFGNEFLFELVAVCKECHARLHPETEI